MPKCSPNPSAAGIRRPARLEYLPELLHFAADAARDLGFSDKRRLEVELACEEALTNIIKHAFPPGSEGEIDLRQPAGRIPGRLQLEIRDRGRAFDPRSRKASDLNLELADRPIGGLGLMFMQKLCDQIDRQRIDGENRLTLSFAPHHENS